ncbi:MAG: sigma-70 family RNA polymerase sigma factor [Kiritimatiellae bacterium]|nr:sigma-70 family RNA polymerase sigma factor [Kiritimatiellia bacterium]MDD5519626.1 sigma-70 family RNA polymerase sigma factor [Kiritimatiellia bacterium]
MEVTDKELLIRYRRGQVDALEALIEKYRRPLFGFIINMIQGRDEADEIFQEVWLRVIRKHVKYKHGNFCGWLVRIAHNVIIDRIRRRKPELSLDEEHEEGLSLGQMMQSNEPEPATRMALQDLSVRINEAVNVLPAEQKEVFLMRVQAELSFSEIARIQKVSINTALARMQYALGKMRTILSKDYRELNEKFDS